MIRPKKSPCLNCDRRTMEPNCHDDINCVPYYQYKYGPLGNQPESYDFGRKPTHTEIRNQQRRRNR